MNRFITFEGIEGSGKTTQLARAGAYLEGRAVEAVHTREPGGTTLGDAVRRVLLDPAEASMTPAAELLLVYAARAQHLAMVVRPALQSGRVVLCDRFEDSTRAYQGHGRGLPEHWIDSLSRLTVGDLHPGLTFLLDLPEEEGLQRARQRGTAPREGRLDDEEIGFHRRVRQGYQRLAAASPERFRVLDAAGPPDEIAARIARELTAHLALGAEDQERA